METIIGAVITTIGTLLVAVLSYNYTIRKVIDDIEEIKKHEGLTKEHEGLTKEHEGLSAEHKNLSKEHEQILGNIKDSKESLMVKVDETRQMTNKINEMIIESKTKEKFRYDNLTEKQKLMIDSIKNLDQLASEIKFLQEEKMKLLNENNNLKVKCNELAAQNNIMKNMLAKNNEQENYPEMEL